MELKSNYALLDVKRGRGILKKRLSKKSVDVIIQGTIKDTADVGNDDGVSCEFGLHVTKVTVVG